MLLDRVDQPRVRDRNRRLVGKRLDEVDDLLAERLSLPADDPEDADDIVVQEDRNREVRPERNRAVVRVLGICGDVGDVHGLLRQRRPAARRTGVDRVRVRPVVVPSVRPAAVGDRVQEAVAHEPHAHVVATAQDRDGLDDLVQHRLEALRPRDRTQYIPDCTLLFKLMLEGVDQPRVRDGDRRLVSEGLHELDVLVGKRLGRPADDPHRADEVIFEENRNAKADSERARSRVGVLGVSVDITDVDDLPCHRCAADHRRPVEQVRMLLVVIPVVGTAAVREGRKLVAFEQMERPVFAVAQPRGGFDDLVHHRLKPLTPGDSAHDRANSPLLLAQVSRRRRA